MIKSDIKAYYIFVTNRQDRVHLICVTYKIGSFGNHFGAEFYELVTTYDNSKFSIPYGRGATFQEKLRTTSTAAEIAPENRDNIEQWIDEKMKETYGQECEVTIEDLATYKKEQN